MEDCYKEGGDLSDFGIFAFSCIFVLMKSERIFPGKFDESSFVRRNFFSGIDFLDISHKFLINHISAVRGVRLKLLIGSVSSK